VVELTKHAIKRFQQRYTQCSNREAAEMLRLAYQEAKPPPKYVRRKYKPYSTLSEHGRVAFYHKFSGLLIVCSSGTRWPHCIVTVISVPFPQEEPA